MADQQTETVRLTHAELRDLRAAYDRDVWAGEWNGVPTAVERILATRLAPGSDRPGCGGDHAGACSVPDSTGVCEITYPPAQTDSKNEVRDQLACPVCGAAPGVPCRTVPPPPRLTDTEEQVRMQTRRGFHKAAIDPPYPPEQFGDPGE